MFVVDAKLAGKDGFIWAVRGRRCSTTGSRTAAGTRPRRSARARVAVVERNIARVTGTRVGDRVRSRPRRPAHVPRDRRRHEPAGERHGALRAADDDARVVSGAAGRRTTTGSARPRATTRSSTARRRSSRTRSAAGYDVGTEIEYVGEADNVASNRTVTTTIAVLGFLIVAISMVGLANAITMSVIERTREVGILRTIGARARDVRRIFATESVVLAVGGWLLGIPVGYLLDVFLVWLVKEVVNVEVPLAFPLCNVVLALVGTVLLALVITLLPIRRAVRYRPGEALRYA